MRPAGPGRPDHALLGQLLMRLADNAAMAPPYGARSPPGPRGAAAPPHPPCGPASPAEGEGQALAHRWRPRQIWRSYRRGARILACPPGYLAIWPTTRPSAPRLIRQDQLQSATAFQVTGRVVLNRTGHPVRVADDHQVIATLLTKDGMVELPDSRTLHLSITDDAADTPPSASPP